MDARSERVCTMCVPALAAAKWSSAGRHPPSPGSQQQPAGQIGSIGGLDMACKPYFAHPRDQLQDLELDHLNSVVHLPTEPL